MKLSFAKKSGLLSIVALIGVASGLALFAGSANAAITNTTAVSAATRQPETFYISNSGNDKSNGTSAQTPWKSIDKVNQENFVPGDKILFKSGDTWENTTLKPKGSGSESANITLSSYGDGDAPKFEGNAKVSDVIHLNNQQHWTISNLDVSNQASGFTNVANDSNGSKLGDYRGIHITGADAGDLSGFDLHNLYVHDVTGKVI